MPLQRSILLSLAVAALMAACSTTPTSTTGPDAAAAAQAMETETVAETAGTDPDGWHDVSLPGKAATQYRSAHKDGRPAIAAVSERSASMWRRRLDMKPTALGDVSFSWYVAALPHQASVADVDREDAAARVLFGFQGDIGSLPARTRMKFDLAQALTGELPPYATLMYVWDASAPVDTVIVNPRTDRIRKIVVDSGVGNLGRWRDHRRDLRADFQRAFGEQPGTLVSMAMMTDSDNTRSNAQAWYGRVSLHPTGPSPACAPQVQVPSGAATQCHHTPSANMPGLPGLSRLSGSSGPAAEQAGATLK